MSKLQADLRKLQVKTECKHVGRVARALEKEAGLLDELSSEQEDARLHETAKTVLECSEFLCGWVNNQEAEL